jgi:hypothetical protein
MFDDNLIFSAEFYNLLCFGIDKMKFEDIESKSENSTVCEPATEVEGVVCGLEGTYLADNSSNVIYSYQVRCMHVHVVAPGQRLYG